MLNFARRHKQPIVGTWSAKRGSAILQEWLQRTIYALFGAALIGFLSFKQAFAQNEDAAFALLGGMALIYLLFFVGVIVVYIWMIVWVNKDAKKRGQSGCMPMALVFLFGPIGLIIWLMMREKQS
jgi:heme/copper-type cytochrome/quinol oxidase subunit 2